MDRIRSVSEAHPLSEVIDLFKADPDINPGETPESAFNRCLEVSIAFQWFCKGRGLQAHLLELKECWLDPSKFYDQELLLESHVTVWLPEHKLSVDWTARQLNPRLPNPWILNYVQLARRWGSISKVRV